MPHQRRRYLQRIILDNLKASPIVGILGQRQTGKTTITESLSREYVTLDDVEQLELAARSAKAFLNNRTKPFAIDECQHVPALFPALKEQVRVDKQMGQFIVTGSVRFTSVTEIKESLTGRIVDLELLPLCLTELFEMPLTNPKDIATARNLVDGLKRRLGTHRFGDQQNSSQWIMDFLIKGGLPGICFTRSDAIRTRKMRSHLKTILDRDLRMVVNTSLDYLTIKSFLEEIALRQGEVFDLAKAARAVRIATNSARKLLSGLESVYLIRTVLKSGNTQGRLVYLEDQAMASFLRRERGFASNQLTLVDVNRFLFQQLRAQINYAQDFQGQLYSFRLKDSVTVDFVLSMAGVNTLAYVVGVGQQASPQQIRAAEAFLRKHPKSKVLLLHLGSSVRALDEQIIEVPLRAVV